MVKSVMVAYALWAVGGLFGLHHFYLGRDSQTLLWILTLGGFGIGWIRDLICIPTYVTEANAETMKRKASNMLHPPVNPVRFAGQVCVGVYFGTVALIGLSFLRFFDLIVLPLCVAAGVHLVSTVGQQTSHLPKTIIASLITSPIFYGSTLSPLPISLAASVTATQHRKYKKPPAAGSTRELGPRLCRLSLAWLAFSAPLAYCVFHNTTATLYYLSDCVAALLDMFWFLPWLRSVLEYILLMPYRFMCVLTGGGYYEEAWTKMLEILLKDYNEQEKEALKVLSLGGQASLEEITRGYRELAKTWHPDHNPSKDSEAMFVKIHEAYEVLLRRHRPRRFT
ncbi:dnaJ homolog subfamily C member 22 isoform X1 [Hippocampus zosterae]|uniref:dnaJ homolog subfamily C member 22 isoform X1 n=1 Tax=Hippocampus zosterae TaxID=109293 RepID=UPI00223D17DD|nr:dnaJ homolog subfamily C member 22 isoform X1 [Hippocampus zosterae]XP_051914132.1 dnaJ homolog subfamily C member 22 isoform X1 [Hippocampus zosterae]